MSSLRIANNDLKIKTESGERFPEAFKQLVSVDGSFIAPLRRCPACGIYFKWIELFVKDETREKTGEQLIRLSAKSSLILENLFSNAPQKMFEPADVADLLKSPSLESLLTALRIHIYPAPQIITPFIPHLLRNLERTENPLDRGTVNRLYFKPGGWSSGNTGGASLSGRVGNIAASWSAPMVPNGCR